MPQIYDRVRVFTATTGAGALTLGPAVPGFRTFAGASVADGEVVTFAIEQGTAWELCEGVYTASGPTLTRSLLSSSTGSLLTLDGTAQVFITAVSDRLGYPGSPWAESAALFASCM
ncbi:MAG: hypothetical protein ACOYOJ_19295 [Alsobacter sp.]